MMRASAQHSPSSEAAIDLVLEALVRLETDESRPAGVDDVARSIDRPAAWVEERLSTAIAAGWIAGTTDRPTRAPVAASGAVIGVDLGGTKVACAVADMAGRVLAEIEEPVRNDRDNAAFDQVAELVERLSLAVGSPETAVRAITLGVPGTVSPAGDVSLAVNLRIDEGRGFKRDLRERLGVETRIENDVNLAAFGECRRGAARGLASMAFISLGTGIGMGLILNGAIHRGRTGAAGEICFLPAGPGPYTGFPHDGGGYFEELVGSRGIRRRHGGGLTVREIFERAEAGDEEAERVVADTARHTALGVAAVSALLDPDMIVLGGGIGCRPPFISMVAAEARRLTPIGTPVTPSALGPKAGLMGAVSSALADARLRAP